MGAPPGLPTPPSDPRAALTPEQAQIVAIAVADPLILAAIAAEISQGGALGPTAGAPASIPPAAISQNLPPGGPGAEAALFGGKMR